MAESKDVHFTTALSSDSKERWAKHAVNKLLKGYRLIISRTKKTANFHKESTGFETCPHRTAMRLVREGFLIKTGEHSLGGIYELKPEFKAKPTSKKKSPPIAPVKVKTPIEDENDELIDPDELDDVIDELDDDLEEEDLEEQNKVAEIDDDD